MKELNRERKHNRLNKFDYSHPGYYFVTICTKEREKYLCEIKNQKIILNKFGEIVKKYWLEIPKHYQNIFLDEFAIMPNHIHGIIIIKNISHVGTEYYSVPTNKKSVPTNKHYGLLSKIIKSFKHACSKYVRTNFNNYSFQWQRSFYDHIVRNEKSLSFIRRYIKDNPINWNNDRNNKTKGGDFHGFKNQA